MVNIQSGKYKLKFRFAAGTSRGELTERDTWFIRISDGNETGFGECAPIQGLSIDALPDFDSVLGKICRDLEFMAGRYGINPGLAAHIDHAYPSVKMGFETALHDFLNGGKRLIFRNAFHGGEKDIPINGLVWMGSREFMEKQAEEKLKEGYSCIKMKIGAVDLERELEILKKLRKKFGPGDLSIRVDANGAYSPGEVNFVLDELAKLRVHSIEQPLRPEFIMQLTDLCKNSPVPVALDESLIGHALDKESILDEIRPAYIVLKPTMLGGFSETADWIRIAENKNIGWWITSFLESNLGLNALCQFVSEYKIVLEQGLGTGQLYHNNITSPLSVSNGKISYSKNVSWELFPVTSLFDLPG